MSPTKKPSKKNKKLKKAKKLEATKPLAVDTFLKLDGIKGESTTPPISSN
jgi:hypothetical protein